MSNKPTSNDIEENKVIAAIGYLGVLCLIPLLLKKDSAYAQFHGKQGLVLLIAWLAVMVIGIIPILGTLIAFVGSIVLLVLSIKGLINAYLGKKWVLPYLGKYAKDIKI